MGGAKLFKTQRIGERMVNREKNYVHIRIGIIGVIGFICCCFLFSCFTRIAPGHVGVVVDLLGDSKGVEQNELGVGIHWVSPWKDVYPFPVFEQNIIWDSQEDSFYFQTKEGLAVEADIGVTYHLNPSSVPLIFQKYRRGMKEITDIFIHNYVRDSINMISSKMAIEDLYGPGKEEFFYRVEKQVRDELDPIGIKISRIYLVGRFAFPQTVIAALNSKIEATQRAQQRENELREAEAQAKKEIAAAQGRAESQLIEAKLKAEANLILSRSLTQELIQYQSIQKWDGKLPQVTGSSIPMIDLGKN